ncbi:MAG: hypothetical protein VX589_17455 [Myxococcota bacterium]|nr:hypothetical protein [Myxococcota bacterium]
MNDPVRALPHTPPRQYGLRDAYRDRVWRSPGGVVGRELFFMGLAVALFGGVQGELAFILLGATIGILGATIGIGGSILTNIRRVKTIQSGLGADGQFGFARRVPLFHELFRRKRECTYILPYTFMAADGTRREGRIWVCGCARDYLPPKSATWVVYQRDRVGVNLPLRIAMMVAPHT